MGDPDAPIVQMIGCDGSYPVTTPALEGCVNHIDATPSAGDICVAGVQAIDALQYEDQGASCHDFVDGSLSHAVEVSGQVVDMKIPGTYLIHYDCQDLSGNRAETSIRTVIIYDTTAPNGETEAGTAAVHATTTSGASKYLVTYTCTDVYTNTATELRTITVKDTLPPVITLHNAADTMVAQGGNGVSIHSHAGVEHNGLNTASDLSTKLHMNPAHHAVTTPLTDGSNTNLMAESSSVNGWLIAAVASAVTGVALLGFSSKRTNQVMVPV